MKKCPKCGNRIGFHHLVGLLLLLRDSIQCKICRFRIIFTNAKVAFIVAVSMSLLLQVAWKYMGNIYFTILFPLLIFCILIVMLSKLALKDKDKNKVNDRLLVIAPSKIVLIFYRYGWLLCLPISTLCVFAFVIKGQTSSLILAIIFLLISVFVPFVFKSLLHSIEASEFGIRKINYKGDEAVKICWRDIVSVDRSPIKIPIFLRFIKSNNGDTIDIGTDQKGYSELIELIRQRAEKIEKIVE